MDKKTLALALLVFTAVNSSALPSWGAGQALVSGVAKAPVPSAVAASQPPAAPVQPREKSVSAVSASYDPLAVPAGFRAETVDMSLNDTARKREVPIKVYLPASKSPAKVVIFSHGLGGSREGSAYLGEHWSARGYAAVFVQHPGSDTSVWSEKPRSERLAALKEAASLQNFMHRAKDIPFVIDQLQELNKAVGGKLCGRLDVSAVGMSGHSFGAVTTQAVSGQSFFLGKGLTDPRIRAAIAMSPSVPKRGSAEKAFGSVDIPWLLLTGTNDGGVINDTTPESRLGVFPALPAGDKYELVLDGAEHSAFTDRALPGDKKKRNPNHHRAILAISTAFWDAYIGGNKNAKAWLSGAPEKGGKGYGPGGVLEKGDRWQSK